MRQAPHTLDNYPFQMEIRPRWNDNDVYGHINNAVYYEYFDTLVNTYLIDNGLLDLGESETIGLVVETGCQYFAPLSFPTPITAGLRVGKMGTSSVRYEIALFEKGQTQAAAQGHFVHVYVDATSRKPTSIPTNMRTTLTEISNNNISNNKKDTP
jgi:acyl-CoA thioester hydrolase